ncbi:outer membrane lipoprotein carrier protein [Andreprevotia lacus DSM 23236]|uniref:Outer-membrane lipoprotein carrier protein n=1 Tax=Andreprevotia lacus DSM 23236 TaxID=1121001 RepID=A0A1W1XZD9_9NEIS|nr:outer membrane lipoprotein chaperone LolA [Andreprevotia lacus]SMC28868.1 outer membrane lipoprotein carrier protein [Andreprevotia lacus DSM 23236]
MTAIQKFALIGSLLLAGTAHADAISDLRTFLAGNTSMQGQFKQTVLSKQAGAKPAVSSGSFAVQRPGKFRWAYASPYEQLIVGDGKQVWLYDADLKQVTIKQVGAALDASPAAVLAGEQIDKQYELRNLPGKDGLAWVLATPRNSESTFRRVEIGLRGSELAEMVLYDQFGQTTRVAVSQLVVNAKIDAGQFRFIAPKDVDVVRE